MTDENTTKYKCPDCGSEYNGQGCDSVICCSSCGAESRVSEGNIQMEKELQKITAERDQLKRELEEARAVAKGLMFLKEQYRVVLTFYAQNFVDNGVRAKKALTPQEDSSCEECGGKGYNKRLSYDWVRCSKGCHPTKDKDCEGEADCPPCGYPMVYIEQGDGSCEACEDHGCQCGDYGCQRPTCQPPDVPE